jgi:hypothetical protein
LAECDELSGVARSRRRNFVTAQMNQVAAAPVTPTAGLEADSEFDLDVTLSPAVVIG